MRYEVFTMAPGVRCPALMMSQKGRDKLGVVAGTEVTIRNREQDTSLVVPVSRTLLNFVRVTEAIGIDPADVVILNSQTAQEMMVRSGSFIDVESPTQTPLPPAAAA